MNGPSPAALPGRQHLDLVRSLVVTGFLLYLPANILPVMTITITGEVEPLTVLGGVNELWGSGLPLVALIVLLASFLVPLIKLVCLAWLLALDGTARCRDRRAATLKVLHQIGSWSMVDIFLLSVLAAVGQLGMMASVVPEPGVLFFAAMLLCTLFATDLYRSEWIWLDGQSAVS